VSVTELSQVFHVPAILTFWGTLSSQHQPTLLFFVFCVVDAAGASQILYTYLMQWGMITTVV
jgi:hypothetical protein